MSETMLTPEEREEALQKRLAHLAAMEAEVRQKEKALKEKEKAKKQVPLRLSATLWEELAAWAEEDFRSINGQIEYLLAPSWAPRRSPATFPTWAKRL